MSDEEHEQTIAEDLVVTKYKMGGDIANREYSEAKSRSLKESALFGLSCSLLTLDSPQSSSHVVYMRGTHMLSYTAS